MDFGLPEGGKEVHPRNKDYYVTGVYRSQRIGKSKDDEELAGYRDTLHIGHITAQFLTNLLDSVAANRFVHIAQLRVIYRAFGNRCAGRRSAGWS